MVCKEVRMRREYQPKCLGPPIPGFSFCSAASSTPQHGLCEILVPVTSELPVAVTPSASAIGTCPHSTRCHQ